MELTELYTFIDDFYSEISTFECWKQLKVNWEGSRGPKMRLSISEIVTMNILRFQLKITDLKSFHRLIKDRYLSECPAIPNYENFLKASNKSAEFTLLIIRSFLYINKSLSENQHHFIDSTPLSVCYNYNINSHKVNTGFADRGKSTKGWFYGFKLHGVCNERGQLEKIAFTPGNANDCKTLEDMVTGFRGTMTCDAGYLVKDEVLEKIFTKKMSIYIATRKNMKRIMTKEQARLFKMRSRIETVWGVLKERFNLMFNLARSTHGLFRHYFYSIVSFLLEDYDKRILSIGFKETRISPYLAYSLILLYK